MTADLPVQVHPVRVKHAGELGELRSAAQLNREVVVAVLNELAGSRGQSFLVRFEAQKLALHLPGLTLRVGQGSPQGQLHDLSFGCLRSHLPVDLEVLELLGGLSWPELGVVVLLELVVDLVCRSTTVQQLLGQIVRLAR